MTVNRKLAPQEQLFEATNRYNGSCNILVISRIKGCIDENCLRKAIALTQQRHPLLNSRIVGALDSLCFESEGVQKIPLRVIENCQEQQWQEIALEEINQAIKSHKVLARVVLLRNPDINTTNYLLTTIHHGIADGFSSLQLQSQILDYYHQIESDQPIDPVESLPEILPVQELIPESIRQSLTEKSSGDLQPSKTRNFETLGFEKIVPRESRRSGMLHRQFNQESTQKLLNTCRQEKTTVHGALCAAILLTAAQKISGGHKKEVPVSCISPVNLRKLLQPVIPNEHLGLIIGNLTSFHKIESNQSFWELARQVRQQIEKSLEGGEIFSTVFDLNIDSMMSNPNQALTTLVVSNLGQVNIPESYGSLKLEEIHFTLGTAVIGGQLFCTVTTFKGRMFLNFPFSQPSLSLNTMEMLVDGALSYLTDVSQGKKVIFDF